LAREKVYSSPDNALYDVFEGAVVLIGGFAGCGTPENLLRALYRKGVGGLTCVCQGAWTGAGDTFDVARLVAAGQVRKLVSPLPVYPEAGGPVEERWKSGQLEVEVVPQGVLAERLRAAGAGLGGVFLPTRVGTRFQEGKERRHFGAQECLLELPLRADFALLRAHAADTRGNLVYRGTQRNWNPVMAMAAKVSIAEVDRICEPGGLDPEAVVTPGIFVHRVVQTGGPQYLS
jgi:3-oxoadipate CoA-transferase alpha subunit